MELPYAVSIPFQTTNIDIVICFIFHTEKEGRHRVQSAVSKSIASGSEKEFGVDEKKKKKKKG